MLKKRAYLIIIFLFLLRPIGGVVADIEINILLLNAEFFYQARDLPYRCIEILSHSREGRVVVLHTPGGFIYFNCRSNSCHSGRSSVLPRIIRPDRTLRRNPQGLQWPADQIPCSLNPYIPRPVEPATSR